MARIVNDLRLLALMFICVSVFAPTELVAQKGPVSINDLLRSLQLPSVPSSAIGVTRMGASIPSVVFADDLDLATSKTRILLLGGLAGDKESTDSVIKMLNWFYTEVSAEPLRRRFALSAVPAVDIDRINGAKNGEKGASETSSLSFPPLSGFYDSSQNVEAAYLWRWIGMHAPDFVLEVRRGKSLRWVVPDSPAVNKELSTVLGATPVAEPVGSLITQLGRTAPSEVGVVPAIAVEVTVDQANKATEVFLQALLRSNSAAPSAARMELQKRVQRTPIEIATDLSKHYGQALNQVAYIPALALVGRIRLSELTGDKSHVEAVEQIVEPYVSGAKLTDIGNGSALPGHLVFCELASRSEGTRRQKYIELASRAANLGLDENRAPRASMPFHSEMSDALFMGGPILARVGKLTGEQVYFEACANHLRFMNDLVLRPDGIYRHSPLDETAWGRGNGFPALGLALCLSDFPESHPGRAELLKSFQAHIANLIPHQDYTGCWRQVIDREDSYREFTATCMITLAIARGIRSGWLERDQVQAAVDRGWLAVKTRIGSNGHLVDVCTGTGKQTSLRAYYDRPAILGVDDRGGAMALMVATEIAQLELAQR